MFHEKSAMKRLSLKTVFLLFQPLCHAIQPSAPRAIPAPLRDLQWGQLNILHTTDTHGWLAGHLHEYAVPLRAKSPKFLIPLGQAFLFR